MKALAEMDIPGYLQRMVASYFTDRILKYDTETGPEEYKITGGVPQGSVLGPLLWNIMYDGLLRLKMPTAVKFVAYADDVAVVIVGKRLEEISFIFDTPFERIRMYRLSALRVASAFRTVSEDAVCVIAGMLPIKVLSEERRALYQQKGATILKPEELRKQERRNSIQRLQILWDNTTKGRWTYHLIRQVDAWVNRDHGEVNYYLTQMISGHGCFRAYLHRFKHEVSSECSYCSGVSEDAEHVFFACPRFQTSRSNWESTVHEKLRPESLIKVMLSFKAASEATSSLATEILQELRRIERRRAMNKNM